MKTIILGDTHGTTFWKLISQLEKDADRFIFIGDYFDSFEIKGLDQINNFLDIIEYKKTSDKEIVLLIGNHII
jgi:predicted phosphodiesterase